MVISAVLREFRGGGAPTLALHRLAVRAANRPVVFLDGQVGCSPSPGFWCDLQASGKILHVGGSLSTV